MVFLDILMDNQDEMCVNPLDTAGTAWYNQN